MDDGMPLRTLHTLQGRGSEEQRARRRLPRVMAFIVAAVLLLVVVGLLAYRIGQHYTRNRSARIAVGDATPAIAEIKDSREYVPNLRAAYADIQADDYVILLTHNADFFLQTLRAKNAVGQTITPNLALAGHTHGDHPDRT